MDWIKRIDRWLGDLESPYWEHYVVIFLILLLGSLIGYLIGVKDMDMGDLPTWISALATVFIAFFTLWLCLIGRNAGKEWQLKLLYSEDRSAIVKVNEKVSSTLNNLLVAYQQATKQHKLFLESELGIIKRQDIPTYTYEAFDDSARELRETLDEIKRIRPALEFQVTKHYLS